MICNNSNKRDIYYFKVGSDEFNWNKAWNLCNTTGSNLPVICNQHDQDALTNFLRATKGISAAWTSGRRTSLNE